MQLLSRDVVDCFSLFLGRSPDSVACVRHANGQLSDLLVDVLRTQEFRSRILSAVLLRRPLPHEQMAPSPPFRLIDWAQQRLPLDTGTRRILGGARSWAQMLEVLLSDPGLTALAPDLDAAGICPVLRERVRSGPLAEVQRAVVGAVDVASAAEVRGWAVDLCDNSVPVTLEFYAGSVFLGAVACSEQRADVREVVGGTGKYGFKFRVASNHRNVFAAGTEIRAVDSLSRVQIGMSSVVYADIAKGSDILSATRGELAQIRLTLERIEARLPELSRAASVALESYDQYWERFYRPSPDVLAEQRSRSTALRYRPLVTVIMPTSGTAPALLQESIRSVKDQTYDHWELIVAIDPAADHIRLLQRQYAGEPRIRWIAITAGGRRTEDINKCLAEAGGDYVALLDHEIELAPEALFSVASATQEHRWGLIYSDEDRIEKDACGHDVHHTPFFKPGWDPDLLLAMNYICHFVIIRREVVSALDGLRVDDDSQYDLVLRVAAYLPAADIVHIPRILHHWRVTPESVAASAGSSESSAQKALVGAVERHLKRLDFAATVESHNDPVGAPRKFATRVHWHLPSPAPTVSIIIPTRDRVDLLRPCIESILRSAAAYPGQLELLIVDNDSAEELTRSYFASLADRPQVRIIPAPGPFNWSAINNAAARKALGEVLIFLNNDTVVLTDDWCVELAANVMRNDVGAAGARLLYAKGTIQHGGVLLGIEGVADHESVGEAPQVGGYFGRSHLLRSAMAVTGACLATRRSLFEQLGGFDEAALKIEFNDVDYCLKLRQAGYRVVYNPFAVLYHFESESRGRELSEAQQTRHRSEVTTFRGRWGTLVDNDPYYNPHFERYARPFDRLRSPPA